MNGDQFLARRANPGNRRARLASAQRRPGQIIEVHISNIHKREAFRHNSLVSLRAEGVIAGLGSEGYMLALRRLGKLVGAKFDALTL